MRNNINKILLVLLTGAVISASCDKKLEEYNPSGITSSTAYTTAKGFETLVNAAYTYTRFWYGKEEGYQISEMGTDIWTGGTGDVYPALSTYKDLQGNLAALSLIWTNFYAAVNLCNTGIAGIAKVTDYTAQQKTAREAELRYLRAFYNWHIVEVWGGVHFTTEPNAGAVTSANKTPVETFYKQIFEDLDYAVKNLPATSAEYGRATIPVAKAFLARMYLTRGMNQQAMDMANEVINTTSYGYQLVPNYGDLWNMGNLKNKEVIWAVDYSTNLTYNDLRTSAYPYGHPRGSNSGHLLFLMVYDQINSNILFRDVNNGRPFNRYMPTKALLDLFNDKIDSRYRSSFQTVWYCNKAGTQKGNLFNPGLTSTFKIGDTVAYCAKDTQNVAEMNAKPYTTYDMPRVYTSNGGTDERKKFYVSLKKFKDSTRAVQGEAQSARDVFVIRLAEMYLIAAEAAFKLGNPGPAATYLNKIRTRAAIPGQEAAMQVSASDITLDFILDERARELAGEQLRWFDLKRTNKLIDRINKMNPDAAAFIKPFHTVRPIPQIQIDAVTNKSEFTQNEGYQ
ncbi:RagB/SusD family nutrient uptake outer membrane protein [Niastella populi]|uniref:Carbohydrate-binding protein SusD n=1 Tax=Niastella populi TaxID=550983 RepID=A0A1V9FD09_9BACT|nr:RagB/SusD family nutrient uptake outer membrane protein [Niastella populi]OQP56259.1 carbohydrate-binding protein SusD [Niastella populi]